MTMKTFLLIAAAVLAITPSISAQDDEKYSKRYDNIDVNTIFRSSRLLNNYVDCLLDKKPCPPEGKDLKRVLPDALKTRCSKCTAVQKEKALAVITRLYYEHPTFYTALAERYDPAGEYTKNFEDWFDEQNALKPGSSFPGPDNVVVNRPTNQLPTDDKTAPPRRMINTDTRFNVDETSTERTRIPTSWVTQRTIMTTTTRQTTTRAPLRTSTGPIRKATTTPSRAPPTYNRLPQPSYSIDNIFAPRPNGPITRSINKLIDSTEKVVNSVAGMFRSTIEIIVGTG